MDFSSPYDLSTLTVIRANSSEYILKYEIQWKWGSQNQNLFVSYPADWQITVVINQVHSFQRLKIITYLLRGWVEMHNAGHLLELPEQRPPDFLCCLCVWPPATPGPAVSVKFLTSVTLYICWNVSLCLSYYEYFASLTRILKPLIFF